MAEFKLSDILRATQGRLLQGKGETSFLGISTDSRTIKPGELFIALEGQNFDGHDFITCAWHKGARGSLVKKDILLPEKPDFVIISVKDTLAALRKIASFVRGKFKGPVIAITGSNGKTTTKEMAYAVLSLDYRVLKTTGNHNNQIGISLALLDLNTSYDLAVIEAGISRVGEMGLLRELLMPSLAVFTNIGRAHLEFLDNLEIVLQEKAELIKNFTRQNSLIINADDYLLRKNFLIPQKAFPVISFGIESASDFRAKILALDKGGLSFEVKGLDFFLPVLGRQNIYNALASICLGSLFGIPLGRMRLALENFHLPPMRMNLSNCDGFLLIDDTYNANPDSVGYALETLANLKSSGRKILVLGNMLELGKYCDFYHSQIAKFILKSKLDILLTVGEYAKIISAQILASNGVGLVRQFSSNQEAVSFLKDILKPGDVVLVKGSRKMHMEEISAGLRQYRRETAALTKW